MVGRFVGLWIMKRITPSRMLSVFATAALVCVTVVLMGTGVMPMWALVLLGFFHSIMFPTIFALSLKHLGAHTKVGSSLLVMAIIGGAFFPAIMGYISDRSNIRYAFVAPDLPLLCPVFRSTRLPPGGPRHARNWLEKHSRLEGQSAGKSGRHGRIRTCNRRIRNPMLYPFELRAHFQECNTI